MRSSAPLRDRLGRLVRGGWLAALALAWTGAPAAEPVLHWQAVAPGVQVQLGAQEVWSPANAGNVGNFGTITGSRCVAVIDTGGSLEVGRRLRADIARATALPVCYVITTHMHPDHLLGNAAFKPAAGERGPEFVGHARLPAALSARGPYIARAVEREFHQTLAPADIVGPTRPVDGPIELDLGDRVIEVRPWPTAHTDNDLTVFDRQTGTLFLGDLLFVGHIPALDGKLRGWLKVMDELARLPVKIAVPGHGAPSTDWPAVMAAQRRYLEALASETKAAIRAGRTIGQAVDSVAAEAAAPWLLKDEFHKRNVTAAFAELEWED